MEYWILIHGESDTEYGLLRHCAALTEPDGYAAALVCEGEDPDRAFACGAQRAYLLHGRLDAQQRGAQIAALARQMQPDAIICSAGNTGRLIAATAAALLETGLAADCTELRRRADGLLIMSRPTFGGSLLADIFCPDRKPQMATVRPGIYLPAPCRSVSSIGVVIPVAPPSEIPRCVLLQASAGRDNHLSTARRIVAGGAGVGSREGFALLGRLAAAMGAVLGASRAAVNAGYAPYAQQIGLTGQVVRPDVYLAFGISGAVQHLAGMDKAKLVIAVNHDPAAPIFEYADYAVAADWRETAQQLLHAFESGE